MLIINYILDMDVYHGGILWGQAVRIKDVLWLAWKSEVEGFPYILVCPFFSVGRPLNLLADNFHLTAAPDCFVGPVPKGLFTNPRLTSSARFQDQDKPG